MAGKKLLSRESIKNTLRSMSLSYLLVSFVRHESENDGLHGGHITEPDLWNVEGANDMGPGVGVRPLEGAIPTRAKLTTLE